MNRRRLLPLAALPLPLLLALAGHAAAPTAPPREATAREVELGKKAAAEFEKAKSTKLLDPKSSPEAAALLQKLNVMATRLGGVSERPGIKYSIKVVEDDDVNAFTLPNGHIYFYRGLIDFAASDDELAGVVAHEIGHNSRMHALRGQAKAKKLSWASLAAMAAVLAGGRSGADVAQFSQYLLIGVMNGYGIEYEKEADTAAVTDMVKAGYNPSALVTFMQRLETKEKRSPEVRLGIFQTHPASEERANACLHAIEAAGVAFTPRQVTGGLTATTVEKADRFSVELGDIALVELAKSGRGSEVRAQDIADRINQHLKNGLQLHQLSVNPEGRLLASGLEVAAASAADAQLVSLTPRATAQGWLNQFQRLFWKERINGRFK